MSDPRDSERRPDADAKDPEKRPDADELPDGSGPIKGVASGGDDDQFLG